MDHAGVFQSSSFMAPDALVGAIQGVALVLALVSSLRLLRRIAYTTDKVVHRLTMLAMFFCTVFAWLTFGYLFFRHKLETCIVRVWSAIRRSSQRALMLTPCLSVSFLLAVLGALDLRGLLRRLQGRRLRPLRRESLPRKQVHVQGPLSLPRRLAP